MSLFDKLKQKSMEKLLGGAMGKDPQAVLKSMGASDADVSDIMQAMKGVNLTGLMGLLSSAEPVTADKVRSLFKPESLHQLAEKLKIPNDQAPEKIAEMMNATMTQLRSAK